MKYVLLIVILKRFSCNIKNAIHEDLLVQHQWRQGKRNPKSRRKTGHGVGKKAKGRTQQNNNDVKCGNYDLRNTILHILLHNQSPSLPDKDK